MPYALSDVAATSAKDVWAVGSAPPYTLQGGDPALERPEVDVRSDPAPWLSQ